MNLPGDRATLLPLLLAIGLAVVTSVALAHMSLPLALGFGLGLAVLIAVVASNELALYVLVFSMLFGPEALVGDLGGGATLGRGITLRVDDFLIGLVGFAWLAKSALNKELGLVFRTPLNAPIGIYASATILATGLGMLAGRVSPLSGSLFVLKYIEYFVIYFMVVNNLRGRRQFERLLGALLLTAALVSLMGILQIPTGQRVSAPFEGNHGEPNTFGGYLVLMLSLVAGLFLTGQSLRRQAALAGLGVLLFIPLLFTLSRASYAALVPAAAILLVFGQRRGFLAAVLAVLVVLAPFALPQVVVDRVYYLFNQESAPSQVEVWGVRLDTSTSDRVRSWREAIVVEGPEHPVFGRGVTGGPFLDAQHPRVLVETGLVGLLAFLWLQVRLFRQSRAILRAARDPVFKGVALGFLAGFIGLVVHSAGANTFIIVRIMEPFWFLAGMVMMIPQLEADRSIPDAPRSLALARGVLAVSR